MPAVPYQKKCDFDGAGHNPIIPAKRGYYIISDGEAQGQYHGPGCYQAALKRYQALKKQLIPQEEPRDEL